jgi:hypothetical protein
MQINSQSIQPKVTPIKPEVAEASADGYASTEKR